MENVPFKQRLGTGPEKVIENDFPIDARIALAYILVDLDSKSYLRDRDSIFNELYRRARFSTTPNLDYSKGILPCVLETLKKMEWHAIYDFCERVYEKLLIPSGYYWAEEEMWVEDASLADVRSYFSKELNLLLAEENIAYHFVEGKFQRRGRAQTQKSIQRMGSILGHQALVNVLQHYNKARHFFDQKPEPDSANCIKEALCAIEACLSYYYKEDFSADFNKAVKRNQGNGPTQIPAPIAESLIKVHAYRGSGQGVAHAAPYGSKVSEVEAELILNLVASYITYIADTFLKAEHDVPF
jgi:hypothetical protein